VDQIASKEEISVALCGSECGRVGVAEDSGDRAKQSAVLERKVQHVSISVESSITRSRTDIFRSFGNASSVIMLSVKRGMFGGSHVGDAEITPGALLSASAGNKCM
jgi:hypothetical protein